jgi:hypothetical protein
MQPIESKLFSPHQRTITKIVPKKGKFPYDFDYENEIVWKNYDATVNRIRASDGLPITSFRQLVDQVALVTINNKNYEMFYRGQNKDYKNNQGQYYKLKNTPKTIIFPPICRPEKKEDGTYKYSIKKSQIIKRYDDLSKMIELVRGKKRSHFDEYYYSLFQHYGILPTPLIDITQSLRVATTFSLRNSSTGYLYVFGLPYPNQSISYFSDLGIVLIKLQNISPVKALRPRYQEGFLVGNYPIRPNKTLGDDLSNRLVAKFFIDNSTNTFWDKYFQPMPDDILFPENDEVEIDLIEWKKKFSESYSNPP